ncbi:MAG TPA: response regulator [Chitinispirillaceae bacterium]|nr:response regulator [Chitinispirillaceae bacterium]
MKRKILVVDDEDTIRCLFQTIFLKGIYDIYTAKNALEALHALKNNTINVIFLDLKLFGMNGINLCRQIRQTDPLAIIHAMTGWAALFDIEECRDAGFDDYFVKPLDIDLITLTVEESFRKLDRWKRL